MGIGVRWRREDGAIQAERITDESYDWLNRTASEVVSLEADGEDLQRILLYMPGLPHIASFALNMPARYKTPTSVKWFGDDARFIAANIWDDRT